jgi:hypothetical protein
MDAHAIHSKSCKCIKRTNGCRTHLPTCMAYIEFVNKMKELTEIENGIGDSSNHDGADLAPTKKKL